MVQYGLLPWVMVYGNILHLQVNSKAISMATILKADYALTALAHLWKIAVATYGYRQTVEA